MKESYVNRGRKAVYLPEHPKSNIRGYVLKSRYLVEQYLGRYLDSWEQVHHCDNDKYNDTLENLDIVSPSNHAHIHRNSKRKLDYEWIENLREDGYGYKKISKITGYPKSSVKSAIKIIEN